jgi:hypothetical protein
MKLFHRNFCDFFCRFLDRFVVGQKLHFSGRSHRLGVDLQDERNASRDVQLVDLTLILKIN